MSTLPKLRYPYRWGVNVVNEFVEKYPRGTAFLAKVCGVDAGKVRHGLVIVLCRGNSVRYESLKLLVKQLNREDPEDFRRFSQPELQLLYRYYLFLAEDEAIDAKSRRDALDLARGNFLRY